MEKGIVKDIVNGMNFNGVSFVSLRYRNPETNEIADYLLVCGAKYGNLLTSDLATLREIRGTDVYNANVKEYGEALTEEALQEMILSKEKSIAGENERAKANIDSRIALNHSTDLFLHDNSLGIHGLCMRKTVVVPGKPRKPVNSRPKTKAKNRFEKVLKTSTYRRFKIPAMATFKTGGKLLIVDASNA